MKTILRSAALAVILSASGATIGAGQAINACYVPAVGAIYLVGLAGLSTACVASGHVSINLSSGTGTLGTGAVGTANLADGAVTTAKIAAGTSVDRLGGIAASGFASASHTHGSSGIADGAVTQPKIALNAVGSSQIANASVTTAKLATPPVGAGNSFFGVSNIGTTPVNLGSVTLAVPGAGRVLLFLSGYAVFFGDNTTLRVGLGTSAGALDLHDMGVGRLDGSGTLRYEHAFAPTAVVTVSAAGTYTYYATAHKSSVFGAHTINVATVKLTALYVPN